MTTTRNSKLQSTWRARGDQIDAPLEITRDPGPVSGEGGRVLGTPEGSALPTASKQVSKHTLRKRASQTVRRAGGKIAPPPKHAQKAQPVAPGHLRWDPVDSTGVRGWPVARCLQSHPPESQLIRVLSPNALLHNYCYQNLKWT